MSLKIDVTDQKIIVVNRPDPVVRVGFTVPAVEVATTGVVMSGGGGLDQATADARYVNVTGDTVSGPIVGAVGLDLHAPSLVEVYSLTDGLNLMAETDLIIRTYGAGGFISIQSWNPIWLGTPGSQPQKLTNLLDPTNVADAATKRYVDLQTQAYADESAARIEQLEAQVGELLADIQRLQEGGR